MKTYQKIDWQEEHLGKNIEIVLTTDTPIIHQIRLKKGKSIYVVPEDFYQAAMAALNGKVSVVE